MERAYSVNEAADILGLTQATVRARAKAGMLKAEKVMDDKYRGERGAWVIYLDVPEANPVAPSSGSGVQALVELIDKYHSEIGELKIELSRANQRIAELEGKPKKEKVEPAKESVKPESKQVKVKEKAQSSVNKPKGRKGRVLLRYSPEELAAMPGWLRNICKHGTYTHPDVIKMVVESRQKGFTRKQIADSLMDKFGIEVSYRQMSDWQLKADTNQ